MMMQLIEVKNLTKNYKRKKLLQLSEASVVEAVNDISFELSEGDLLGLVGESGCGKTTLGKLIMKLIEPDSGSVYYKRRDIFKSSNNWMKTFRRECRMIFQGLDASLNPHMTIEQIVEEPLKIHTTGNNGEIKKRVEEVLELVRFPTSRKNIYPHSLSGGEKRRISIARAIAVPPRFLVADEPFSAIDVSIRAQLIQLFKYLFRELNLTVIIISHDIGVVTELCRSISVMYAGKIIERCSVDQVISGDVLHPYSKTLLSSVLSRQSGRTGERPILTATSINDMRNLHSEIVDTGCRYRYRCSIYVNLDDKSLCDNTEPKLESASEGRSVACHHAESVD